MGKSSKHQRRYWYKKCVQHQHGEYCKGCGRSSTSQNFTGPFSGLIVDKINNDGNHNINENKSRDFQLLCKSCNKIKNPRKPSKQFKPKSIMTYSEKTNQRAEPDWKLWIEKEVKNAEKYGEGFPIDDAIYGGAELFDISPETIERRYLQKITSISGRFTIKDDKIHSKRYLSKY